MRQRLPCFLSTVLAAVAVVAVALRLEARAVLAVPARRVHAVIWGGHKKVTMVKIRSHKGHNEVTEGPRRSNRVALKGHIIKALSPSFSASQPVVYCLRGRHRSHRRSQRVTMVTKGHRRSL